MGRDAHWTMAIWCMLRGAVGLTRWVKSEAKVTKVCDNILVRNRYSTFSLSLTTLPCVSSSARHTCSIADGPNRRNVLDVFLPYTAAKNVKRLIGIVAIVKTAPS
jgi:hypothetical protein